MLFTFHAIMPSKFYYVPILESLEITSSVATDFLAKRN